MKEITKIIVDLERISMILYKGDKVTVEVFPSLKELYARLGSLVAKSIEIKEPAIKEKV